MPDQRRQRSDAVRPVVAEDRIAPPTELTDEAIRDRAYELYQARGGEPGHDLDDWLRAERDLRARRHGAG